MRSCFRYSFLIISFFALSVFRAQPLHEYFFNNTLAGTNGGPTLNQSLACGALAGSFGSQTITTSQGTCAVATAFCFNAGGGLSYPNPSYITNQYSINLFFKFNVLGGWSRIIDFSNSTADAGIYLLGNCLNFFPNGNVGTCPFFNANIYYLFTFVRDGSTNIISVYVNGTLFGTYNDAGNLYRPATNTTPIIFFRDDNAVPCEVKAGCVKYASISSATMTAAQVAATWTNVCSIVLPVELTQFEAKANEFNVDLNWTTLTEKDNKLFEIEHSTDATSFSRVGVKEGGGDSYSSHNYTFTHTQPKNGTNYYRLKQVDYSGAFKYSEIKALEFRKPTGNFYPNPANEILILEKEHDEILIRNQLGEVVLKSQHEKKIITSSLPSGIYILSIGTQHYNLVIQH